MRTTNSSHFPLPTRRKLAFWSVAGAFLGAGALAFFLIGPGAVRRVDAQEPGPSLTDPNLTVLTVASGFTTPIGIAFLGANDWFVIEKQTGQVKHLVNGAVDATVLDLAVNNASERGLLSIALHPNFATNHFVYLFWTCQAAPPPPESPFFPTATTCADTPELGADTGDILAVPLLGNRVDRFVWDAGTSTLTFDKNLIKLRSFQNDGAPDPPNQGDEAQPPRGNHNGGVTRFGPDGKLYIFFGDQGRRGQLQNLPSGPTLTGLGATVPDDQFGGPEPDNAHFSGVVIRLNDDGSTPTDNPFFAAGASMGGEVGANVQKIFAYGLRNSFGLAFDPESGNLWESENGEDAYDELNRIEPGMNGGWIQIQGPSSRVPDYRFIETTFAHEEAFPNLQQFRWGPERIAQTPAEALSRLFMLPGAHFSEPEFAWRLVVPPAAIGFVKGRALGPQFEGDLFVGAAEFDPEEGEGGQLFRFNLTGNRRKIGVDEPGLEDRVDDNVEFGEPLESEPLEIGERFGIVTDIKTGPNGNLFVVSLSDGNIYEISRRSKG